MFDVKLLQERDAKHTVPMEKKHETSKFGRTDLWVLEGTG